MGQFNPTGTAPCGCDDVQIISAAVQIANGSLSPLWGGIAAQNFASFPDTVQSVTVMARRTGSTPAADYIEVQFNTFGSNIQMLEGETLTWSVTDSADALDKLLRILAVGDSAAIVSWTYRA